MDDEFLKDQFVVHIVNADIDSIVAKVRSEGQSVCERNEGNLTKSGICLYYSWLTFKSSQTALNFAGSTMAWNFNSTKGKALN